MPQFCGRISSKSLSERYVCKSYYYIGERVCDIFGDEVMPCLTKHDTTGILFVNFISMMYEMTLANLPPSQAFHIISSRKSDWEAGTEQNAASASWEQVTSASAGSGGKGKNRDSLLP